jgi:hypothetical protein
LLSQVGEWGHSPRIEFVGENINKGEKGEICITTDKAGETSHRRATKKESPQPDGQRLCILGSGLVFARIENFSSFNFPFFYLYYL